MREPSEFYYCLKEQLKKIRIQEENERELEEIRKIIAAQKLFKKENRRHYLSKRQTWGELSPVTRKPVSSKTYNRKKTQGWKRDYSCPAYFS